MSAETSVQNSTQYLSFFIGDEEYGLGILESKEIIQYPTVTKVPSMPPAIRGVINLRGSVVPVLDLAVLFGFAERPITKWTCIVVVEATELQGVGADLVGIVVDGVSQVMELSPNDIEPPPAFGTKIEHRFLRGMGKTGKSFVLILALERLLTHVKLDHAAAAEALAPGGETPHAAPMAPPEGTGEGEEAPAR